MIFSHRVAHVQGTTIVPKYNIAGLPVVLIYQRLLTTVFRKDGQEAIILILRKSLNLGQGNRIGVQGLPPRHRVGKHYRMQRCLGNLFLELLILHRSGE